MLLCLLQNGWSRWYTRIGKPGEEYQGMRAKVWQRDDWIEATWACPTGQKLGRILGGVPQDEIWLDDTTLELAPKAAGVCKPDPDHVRSVLSEHDITHVLACGKQAHTVIDKLWRGPCVKIPHPAVRGLTGESLAAYKTEVDNMRVQAKHGTVYRCSVDVRGCQMDGRYRKGDDFGKDWIIPAGPGLVLGASDGVSLL